MWLSSKRFLLFEKSDGGSDVRRLLLSFWNWNNPNNEVKKWRWTENTWRTVRESKRWSSRDVSEFEEISLKWKEKDDFLTRGLLKVTILLRLSNISCSREVKSLSLRKHNNKSKRNVMCSSHSKRQALSSL